MKKIYFDTETSGLTPGYIAQLSMIIEDGERLTAKNYYFNVEYIEDGAAKVTGRDKEFYTKASQGKVFADYADEIYDTVKDSLLIAHNIKFDENFLSTEFWRVNKMFKPLQRFDTMEYFRPILKIPGYGQRAIDGYKNPKLVELVSSMNINTDIVAKYASVLFMNDDAGAFHDAMFDTTAMFVPIKVYDDMIHGNSIWIDKFCKK